MGFYVVVHRNFSNCHSILNPLKLLSVKLWYTIVQGIALVKSAGNGMRDEDRFRYKILDSTNISCLQMLYFTLHTLLI